MVGIIGYASQCSGKNGGNSDGNGSGEATRMKMPTVAALAAAKISDDDDNCDNAGKNDDGDSGRRRLL